MRRLLVSFLLQSDFTSAGDLSTALKHQRSYLSEEVILDWFVQLCLGLKHIHDRKILHR